MDVASKKIYKADHVPVEFHDIDLIALKSPFSHIHWHENIEIMFFIDGISENIIDNNVVQENTNDIVVINAGVLHGTRAISKNAKYYALIIDKDTCYKYGFVLSDYYIKSEINDVRLFSLVDEIQNEFTAKKEHYEAIITAKTLEMLTILFRDYSFKKNNLKHNKNVEMVKNGIRYIKNNYTKNITIDDVAKSTGYSKYYFCRSFKEITKYTIGSYINSLRVNAAYKLIAKKGLNVSQAACECGFDDISYFTKIFKKYTGVLPSQIKAKDIALEDE